MPHIPIGHILSIPMQTVYTDDKVPGQKYYYATDVALKTEKPISEEQAKEIRGKYTYEKLQFTPFVN